VFNILGIDPHLPEEELVAAHGRGSPLAAAAAVQSSGVGGGNGGGSGASGGSGGSGGGGGSAALATELSHLQQQLVHSEQRVLHSKAAVGKLQEDVARLVTENARLTASLGAMTQKYTDAVGATAPSLASNIRFHSLNHRIDFANIRFLLSNTRPAFPILLFQHPCPTVLLSNIRVWHVVPALVHLPYLRSSA
jgi:hypothetical protein